MLSVAAVLQGVVLAVGKPHQHAVRKSGSAVPSQAQALNQGLRRSLKPVYAMLQLHLYSIKGLLLSFAFSPGLGLLSFLQRQWRQQTRSAAAAAACAESNQVPQQELAQQQELGCCPGEGVPAVSSATSQASMHDSRREINSSSSWAALTLHHRRASRHHPRPGKT